MFGDIQSLTSTRSPTIGNAAAAAGRASSGFPRTDAVRKGALMLDGQMHRGRSCLLSAFVGANTPFQDVWEIVQAGTPPNVHRRLRLKKLVMYLRFKGDKFFLTRNQEELKNAFMKEVKALLARGLGRVAWTGGYSGTELETFFAGIPANSSHTFKSLKRKRKSELLRHPTSGVFQEIPCVNVSELLHDRKQYPSDLIVAIGHGLLCHMFFRTPKVFLA